ncbi:DUF6270 domain-containing protein [Brachybacterium hainanense]|uniref:DUF6270 domain-containing protein n=1 Tax=Brachybacterium hainanense TaxID=1541174 RepID=A0ABV6RIC6_9MICO
MTNEDVHDEGTVRTFIWGSCVSRDTFGFLPETFRISRYVARQSLISAGTDASFIRPQLTPLRSAFQQRMVLGDLSGDLYRALEADADSLDIVLIDLVDERGGVVDLGGGYATKLSEFWGAGGREASRGAHQIEFGTDEHFSLWSAGARRLVQVLRDRDLVRRTLVLRAPWASSYDTGEDLEMPAWMMRPADADQLYGRYFDHLSALGLRIVELPEELARTSKDHRWGASPFHYQNTAYEHFARAISEAAEAPMHDPLEPPAIGRRDTSPWGSFTELPDIEAIRHADLGSRFFTLRRDGIPIDVEVDDVGASTTLVSFHAALGKSTLQPPVFTGRSISADIGVNRIFVSDPGLLMGEELGLAWYLGTDRLDVTTALAQMIAAFQERMGAEHLAFFGMSGGGFAALNLSHEFPGSLAIPVNPQTRILDYAEVHWDAMARACFGASSVEESRAVLESHPRADLRKIYRDGFSNSVIYVQNAADPHISSHLIPWFDAIGWSGEAMIHFGRWGAGHVPPPAPQLRALLSQVAGASGSWRDLARAWGADLAPTREMVREKTGR